MLHRKTAVAALAAALALAIPACSDPTPVRPERDSGPRPDGSVPEGDAGPLTDEDGDTIADRHEGGALDSDGDGTLDTADDDSDGDGILDRDEAGDGDLATAPIDTDLDGAPDFRDRDSDGDGLADADERTAGTDPRASDSDGDGVPDLAEVIAMTDPLDMADNPRAMGDFYFLVPYMEDPDPPRDTLVFATVIQRADVYFSIDTSISMQDIIDNVRANLTTTIVPGLVGAITDVRVGVGQFDRCPPARVSMASCVGIVNELNPTADTAMVDAALGRLSADCSGAHEPYAQSMWLFATGDASRWAGHVTPPSCPAGTVGFPCVRGDALPILVMVGDEPFTESHNVAGGTCSGGVCSTCATFPTDMEVVDALNAIRARVVVIGRTGSATGAASWRTITMGTGSVDSAGRPLIFPDATSATAASSVVDAIVALAQGTPLDVSARARDVDHGDGVDATMFIERIEANVVGGVADPRDATRVCVGGLPATDADGDGFPDTFPDVMPGTPVCFDIVARRNETVMPTSEPQIFRAEIDVLGDGITVLDTREVLFLVPPEEGTILM